MLEHGLGHVTSYSKLDNKQFYIGCTVYLHNTQCTQCTHTLLNVVVFVIHLREKKKEVEEEEEKKRFRHCSVLVDEMRALIFYFGLMVCAVVCWFTLTYIK